MFDFDLFCDRFNELIKGKSQLELSKVTGLSQPVISKLKKHIGQAPSADTIVKLANYFNVSTDWLLGLTDVKSTDKATKSLCDTLGLNEETIELLQNNKDTFLIDGFNWLAQQHVKSAFELDEKVINALLDGKVDEFAKTLFQTNTAFENSILYNLSALVNFTQTNSNVIIKTGENLILDVYNENNENKAHKIALENVILPIAQFDFKKALCTTYASAINREILKIVDKIMDEQIVKNQAKTFEFLKNLETNREGE